jgi:hypothetical protein
VEVKRLERKTGFPPSNGHTNLCGICPFKEACTVYQHLLRDNYYRYPSWEVYHAQRKMCEEGRRLREEREKEQARGQR